MNEWIDLMVKNVAWSPQSVWLFFKLLLSSSFCSLQYFSYSSNSRQINTYIIKQISRIHKHATYTEEIFGSRANERKAKELHIDVYSYESSRLINFWRNFSENATHTKLKSQYTPRRVNANTSHLRITFIILNNRVFTLSTFDFSNFMIFDMCCVRVSVCTFCSFVSVSVFIAHFLALPLLLI